MGWSTKLIAGNISKGKSEREQQDDEKHEGKEEDTKPKRMCELKAQHRRRRGFGWCEDAYNCGDCWYFQKYAPPHIWVCCRCLRLLEREVQFEVPVLELYHSGFCKLCKEETLLLTPVLTGGGDD